MAGTLDGRNIEYGTMPLDRLAEDVVTQTEYNNLVTAINQEAVTRANNDTVLQNNIDNLESSVNANYVHKTGSVDEDIDGDKRFLNNITVEGNLVVNGNQIIANTEDLTVTDNVIVLNNGETGAGVSAGISGITIDRGTETNYRIIFSETDMCVKVGLEGSEKCLATKEYVDNNGSSSGGLVAIGTGNFAGNGNSTLITFTPDLGTRSYQVSVTPSEDTQAYVGEIYWERVSGTQFRVYNTGSGTTSFTWGVGVGGVLPSSDGAVGGDLSGNLPNPTVVGLQGVEISNTAPVSGQFLGFDGSKWTPTTGSGTPSGAAGGDLSGTYPNPTVSGIQGVEVSTNAPSDGQALIYDSTAGKYVPGNAGGGATDLNGLSDVVINAPAALHTLLYNANNAVFANAALQLGFNSDVVINSPSNGQALVYSSADSAWKNTTLNLGGIDAWGTVNTGTSGQTVYINGFTTNSIVTVGPGVQTSNNGRGGFATVEKYNGYFILKGWGEGSSTSNIVPVDISVDYMVKL